MKEKFIVYFGKIEGDTDYKFFETEDEAFDYAWNVKKYKTPKELKNCVIEVYSTKNEDVNDMEEWHYLCTFNPRTVDEFIKEIKRIDKTTNCDELIITMSSNEKVYIPIEEAFEEEMHSDYCIFNDEIHPDYCICYEHYKIQNNR